MKKIHVIIMCAATALFVGLFAAAQPITNRGLQSVSHDSTMTGSGVATNPLGVNTTTLQERVTGTCSSGTSITAVASDGTVTCTAGGLNGLTNNKILKATGANTVGDSSVTDDGTTLTIGDSVFSMFTSGSDTFTFGNGASDVVHLVGSVSITGAAPTQITTTGPVSFAYAGTTQTTAKTTVDASETGSFNTTSGALQSTGVSSSVSSTRSSGSNNLTNVALYGTAAGGQVNRALQTDAGDVLLNNTGGTATLNGATTVNANFTIGSSHTVTVGSRSTFNSTAPVFTQAGISASSNTSSADPLDVSNALIGQAADIKEVTINDTGTYDISAGDHTAYGLYATVNPTISAGGGVHQFNTVGIYATSSGHSVDPNGYSWSAYFDSGDVGIHSGTLKFGCPLNSLAGCETSISSTGAGFGGDINLNSHLISSVATPVSSTDAATKGYVDGVLNHYSGTYFEWDEDWFARTTNVGQSLFECVATGTGASPEAADTDATTGRPGVEDSSVGTTATGRSGCSTSLGAVVFNAGDTYVSDWVGGWPTLSNSTDGYSSWVGFYDTLTSQNSANGCYFLYDERASAAFTTGSQSPAGTQALNCVCASANARTEYPMNGSTVSDESFTTVATTVSALTYPNTGWLNLKVVVTGTTRAEFYVNGVKSCDINTHIPTNPVGSGFTILKNVGTTNEHIKVDFSSVAYTLGSARSP